MSFKSFLGFPKTTKSEIVDKFFEDYSATTNNAIIKNLIKIN